MPLVPFRSLAVAAALTATAAALSPAHPAAQASAIVATWKTSDIVIDGSMADWAVLTRIGDGPAVAAMNDATHLYLAVASNDPTVRVQLATGLIVWIDGTARRQQTFGLRVEGLSPRPLSGSAPPAETLPDRVRNPLDRFDLLGPARLQRRLIDDAAAAGFALASGVEDDTVVYEMQIPLAKTDDRPYAVGTQPGSTVSVGLETPPALRQSRERRRLADPRNTKPWLDPGGYGGYFTTPPPPPGGWPKAPPELKPLKLLWTSVRLADVP